MTARQPVAAFDVDGTLTVRDCVVPFLRTVRGTVSLSARLGAQGHRLAAALARRDRDRVKAVASVAAFAGIPEERLVAEGVAFGHRVAAEWLRDDTVERLGWHRAQGHLVVLVSASYEVYLRHVGDHLGVDAVLGTRLEVVDGRCTGRLDGANCRGPEKVARLHTWLATTTGGRGGAELWAYGDSEGDRAMLAGADHPVWAAGPLGNVAPRV